MHTSCLIQRTLYVLSVWSLALSTVCAEPCPTLDDYVEEETVVTHVCDAQGMLRQRAYLFTATGLPALEEHYQAGKIVKKIVWSLEGRLMTTLLYEHAADGSMVRKKLGDDHHTIIDQQRFASNAEDRLLEKWYFDADQHYALTFRERYVSPIDSGRNTHPGELVTERLVYATDGQLQSRLEFYYPSLTTAPDASQALVPRRSLLGREQPIGFVEYDPHGQVQRAYFYCLPFDFEATYGHLPTAEYRQRRQRFEAPDKIAVAILDTGVDYRHPDLAYLMAQDARDPIDGVDNDGNGWVDDQFGWNGELQSHLPCDMIRLRPDRAEPLSHGTHVASIATQGLDFVALVAFNGNFADPVYLFTIAQALQRRRIRFANLSFGFDSMIEGNTDANAALTYLVRHNPQTLFTVAAGNDGRDIDAMPSYPCAIPADHVLCVGALQTSAIEVDRFPEYTVADFSDVGSQYVDLFAPGVDVQGAALGGGSVRLSGTSMAAPFVLHVAVQIAHLHPQLQARELKELLLKTAYIPDLARPLPAVSGGMIFPQRALLAAQVFVAQPHLSVEAAALSARASLAVSPAEAPTPSYLQSLQALWRARGL